MTKLPQNDENAAITQMSSHTARPSTVELFDRSVATLICSWAYMAAGSPGAEVIETHGAVIAAFVHSPDREFLNNTLLTRGLSEVGPCLDRVERVYADRGIEGYAVWVHESEGAIADEVKNRGYRYDTSTRAMAMPIGELADVDTSDWTWSSRVSRSSGASTASMTCSQSSLPSGRISISPAATAWGRPR